MDNYLFDTYLNENICHEFDKIIEITTKRLNNLQYQCVIDQLKSKILKISLSALIQDIHDCRDDGILGSSNTKEQYAVYDSYFKEKNFYSRFMLKYPLLKEKTDRIKKDFIINIEFLVSKIIEDELEIKLNIAKEFSISDIILFHFDQGDTHNDGKSVIIIETKKGKIVYKPHTLSNEKFFNFIINKLNRAFEYDIVTIKNIDKKDYGWQEYVEEKAPINEEDKEKYYTNLGRLTALSYCLTLTDIHYDNILVCNTSPIFYDIETLVSAEDTSIKKPNMINNVLNTSILPVNNSEVFEGVDISGMFGNHDYKDQYFQVKNIIDPFTSDIRIIESEEKLKKKSEYNDDICKMDPMRFTNNFICGFIDCGYRIVQNKLKFMEWIEENISKNNVNRVILRDTQLYAEFIEASHNAEYLTSKKKESELFDILTKNKNKKISMRLTLSEINQMKNCDVPYFYHSITMLDLMNKNKIVEKSYYEKTVYEKLMKYVKNLNEKDIDFQVSIIEKTFLLVKDKIFSNDHYDFNKNLSKWDFDNSEIIDYCEKYLDQTLKKNIYYDDKNNMNFINVKMFPTISIQGMDYELYENLGIILPMIMFEKIKVSRKYDEVIKAMYIRAYERLKLDINIEKASLSVFSGIGSLIYVGSILYNETLNEKYLNNIEYLLQESFTLVEKTNNIDYIDGLSGYIVCLYNISKKVKIPLIKPLICNCSERMYNLIKTENGSIDGNGIAHGVSGILYGLTIAYKVTSNKKYKAILENLMLRMNKIDSDSLNAGWCRGIPGILVAISEVKKLNNTDSSEKLLIKYSKLLENEVNLLNVNGLSLCHGLSGNLCVIRKLISNNDLKIKFEDVKKIENMFIEITQKTNEMPIGQTLKFHQHNVEGLMLGGSGILYELLAVEEKNLPNILMLEL